MVFFIIPHKFKKRGILEVTSRSPPIQAKSLKITKWNCWICVRNHKNRGKIMLTFWAYPWVNPNSQKKGYFRGSNNPFHCFNLNHDMLQNKTARCVSVMIKIDFGSLLMKKIFKTDMVFFIIPHKFKKRCIIEVTSRSPSI